MVTMEQHATCLLKAEGLKKAFGGQIVLESIDLELREGEVVLLRGENGSGKTTLLNILTGNLEADAGTIHYLADDTPRAYRFPRHWWQELNPFDHFTSEFVAREGMGRTWQEIRLFSSQTLRDNIAIAEPDHPGENPIFALLFPGRSGRREAEINREAKAMLARLGLAGRETSSADKISLGQSKRVAIARAVAAGAKVLFLDEPLAGLDRRGIAEVLARGELLVDERAITLVIVEHVFNQPHLRHLVTTDWLLMEGTMQKRTLGRGASGSTGYSFTSRPPWFHLLATADAEVRDEPLPRGALLTHIRRAHRRQLPAKPVLEIRSLIVKRGSRAVIGMDGCGAETGFDLTLHEGEIAILQAPNGWGKTTLFAAICGLIEADAGSIYLEGQQIQGLPTWDRVKRGLCALESNHDLFPALRVTEVLRLAEKSTPSDLGALVDRTCSSLSGGEKRRVALSSLPPGRIGIHDEPFAALDENSTLHAARLYSQEPSRSYLLLLPGEA